MGRTRQTAKRPDGRKQLVCGGSWECCPDCPRIESRARFAIENYNKKKKKDLLLFVKVLKAYTGSCAGVSYDITMEVKNGDRMKIYDTSIWEKPWMNWKRVTEFKCISGNDDLPNSDVPDWEGPMTRARSKRKETQDALRDDLTLRSKKAKKRS